jgi:hypothetical protein
MIKIIIMIRMIIIIMIRMIIIIVIIKIIIIDFNDKKIIKF